MEKRHIKPLNSLSPVNSAILYEDNHLLALFKPAGLLTQGDQTGDPTLISMAREYIKKKYDKPGNVYIGLVHRLDRPVAGVVIFAKTSKGASRLCEQIKNHEMKKIYWAVIHGNLIPPEGEISGYIIRHSRKSFISAPTMPKAQKATLSYHTLDATPELSLIEISLQTGRHHQIRVQMADRGHPILGDKKYGSRIPLPGKNIALLAKKIEVFHPITREKLVIESPLPDYWPWPAMPPV